MRAGEDHDGPAFAALASLSPADQELLRLVAWEELGNQQIARSSGSRRTRSRSACIAPAHASPTPSPDSTPDDDLKYLDPSRTSADVKGTDGAAWKGAAE